MKSSLTDVLEAIPTKLSPWCLTKKTYSLDHLAEDATIDKTAKK